MKKFIKQNRCLWDIWTEAHTTTKSDIYDVEAFCSGQTTLKNIEISELGDISGKSLLHLQCHFGLDTLSLARDKKACVTGVDLSPKAIEYARRLSRQCNIPAEFICCDIYELPKVLNKKFDVVFASYGVLTWLYDINEWAEIITNYLKPCGIFYMVEFHPFTHMFDENWQSISEPYFYNNDIPLETKNIGSYAHKEAAFTVNAYEWPHTLSEVITALCKVGLIIEFFHEFPYVPYNCFPGLEQVQNEQYVLMKGNSSIPLLYSVKAHL